MRWEIVIGDQRHVDAVKANNALEVEAKMRSGVKPRPGAPGESPRPHGVLLGRARAEGDSPGDAGQKGTCAHGKTVLKH